MRTIADAVERIEQTLGRENRADAGWDESKHKRGKDGKFGSGGGSSKKSTSGGVASKTSGGGSPVNWRGPKLSLSPREADDVAKSAIKDGETKEEMAADMERNHFSPAAIKRAVAAFEQKSAESGPGDRGSGGNPGIYTPKSSGEYGKPGGSVMSLNHAHDWATGYYGKELSREQVVSELKKHGVGRMSTQRVLNAFDRLHGTYKPAVPYAKKGYLP